MKLLALTSIAITWLVCDAVEHCADEMTTRARLEQEVRFRSMLEMFRLQHQLQTESDDTAENSKLTI